MDSGWLCENLIPLISTIGTLGLLLVDRFQLTDLRKHYKEENMPQVIPHLTEVYDGSSNDALLCLSMTNYSKVVAEDFHFSVNGEWMEDFNKLSSGVAKKESLNEQIKKYRVYLVPGDSLVIPLFVVPGKAYMQMSKHPMIVTVEYYETLSNGPRKLQQSKQYTIDFDSISPQLTTPDSYVRIQGTKIKVLNKINDSIRKTN